MPKFIFNPGRLILKDYVKFTAPVIMNETLWGFGTSIFPVVFGHMANSSDIVSASSIAGNIQNLVSALIFGLANSTAVIIGSAIGGGRDRDEVFSIGKTLSLLSVLIGAAAGGLLLLATFTVVKSSIFPLFGLTPNAQRIATMMLCVLSGALIGVSYNTNNIVGILRGGGDVRAGMIIDVTFMYLYAVPAALLSGLVFKADITLVYILIKLEELIKTAVGFARFISGKWIKNVTRDKEAFLNES
jgi:Na+-driven multidrug efflux pump